MKSISNFFLFILLIIPLINSCNSVEPPSGLEINLKLEDVSCAEAWITLSSNIKLPAAIELKKDNQVIKTINLTKSDSLLYLDSLLPNSSYRYQASNSQYRVTSNQLQLTTLDTTSHNFSFTSYQFGEHSSSVLYDVTIINENSIYAVGEIYLNDSLGQPDPHPYGLVHWDGSEWNVNRITAQNPSGGYSYIIPTGIFAVSPTEIWLARGGVYLFNGDSITQAYWLVNYSGYNGGIFNNGESASKLWGISSQDLYTVGVKGALAHFNGTNWQKIESGTQLNINGIWGDYDKKTNEWEILAVGGDILVSSDRIILKITNTNQVQQISTQGTIEYPLSSLWFKSKIKYYVAGAGIYTTKSLDEQWHNLNLPNYYGFSIKGTGLNDVVVCGGAGYVGHFNGYSWRNYLDGELQEITGNYYSTEIKGNTIVAVGNTAEGKAVVVLGKG